MLALVLVAVLIGFVLVYSFEAMARTYANGELEPTIIRTPLYMIYAGMVFGLFVFLLQALCDLVKVARACKTLAPGDASRALIFRSPWFCLRSEEHTSELQSLMRISY